jgi:hypothetical protein
VDAADAEVRGGVPIQTLNAEDAVVAEERGGIPFTNSGGKLSTQRTQGTPGIAEEYLSHIRVELST